MIVIECKLGDGTVEHHCYLKQADADKAWPGFVNRGSGSPGEKDAPQSLIMHGADTDSVEVARDIVTNGGARKIKRVAFYKPPQLEEKVSRSGPGLVDEATMQKARDAVAEMTDDYLDWARDGFCEMDTLLTKIGPDNSDNSGPLEDFFSVAYRAKGMGGTFDYQLVTMISERLCDVLSQLSNEEPLDAKDVKTLRVHVDALHLVILKNLTGDGGQVGKALIDGLDALQGAQAINS